VAGDERELALIFQVCLAANRFEADRAVHRPGIEKIKPQPLGNRASD
jgi:hypothetical protein